MFYPTLSQRSCHVQHSTCNQNIAINSTLNINEFQVSFSPLYYTVSKCILHGKSAYNVHMVCSYIAQNARWITGLLFNNIAAIMPCTTLYLQPNYSRTVCFQYTRVSNCFFNTTLYCKTAYYTWEKCRQCAYGALNNGCFIQRYRSDLAMYSTLPAAIMQPDTRFSIYKIWSWFFTIILYCKHGYFTWEKCIQCAYSVFLHCTECALNNGCFIQR